MIRESSNLEETSSDSELSDWQRDNMDYAKAMTESQNLVDQRLISLYKTRKAHQMGQRLGFEAMLENLKPYHKRLQSKVMRKLPTLFKNEEFFIPRSQVGSECSMKQRLFRDDSNVKDDRIC